MFPAIQPWDCKFVGAWRSPVSYPTHLWSEVADPAWLNHFCSSGYGSPCECTRRAGAMASMIQQLTTNCYGTREYGSRWVFSSQVYLSLPVCVCVYVYMTEMPIHQQQKEKQQKIGRQITHIKTPNKCKLSKSTFSYISRRCTYIIR